MQILPQNPSWGQSLGEALGTGLGAGLQGLAEAKLDQISRQRQAVQAEQGLIGAGVDPKMARQMRSLPPHLLQEAFKYQLKGPQEQALAQAYSSLLGGGQPQEQMQQQQYAQAPTRSETPGQYTELARRLAPSMAASNMMGRPGVQPQAQAAAQKQATMQQQAGMPQAVTPEQVTQRATQMPALPKRLSANDFRALTQMYMQKQNMDQKQAMGQAKLDLQKQHQEEMKAYHEARIGVQQEKQTHTEKKASFKETSKARTEIVESAKSAKENDMRLNRIKELDKKGNIQNPILYSILNKMGLDIPALRSADSQELEKLSNDFLKSAKNVFGTRLTNFDVETFFKTVPTLSQTKEGRARVIRNLQLFNDGALIREKTMRDILKENKNIPPMDLAEQVEERMAPELDRISQEFKSGAGAQSYSVGQKLSGLPAVDSLPVGAEIRKKDGTVLRNTGTKWQEV